MDEIQRNTNFKEQAENNTGSEIDKKKIGKSGRNIVRETNI